MISDVLLRFTVLSPFIARQANMVIHAGASSQYFHLSCCQSGKLTRDDTQKMVDNKRMKPKNSYGPLIDAPDWSYLDGRPAPPGSRATRRKEIQKQICERIIDLNKDIDYATQRTQRMKSLRTIRMAQRRKQRF